MDFSLIKQAGMTQAEFGAILPRPVGRATVNLWVNGRMKPNRYIKDDVAKTLGTIAQALSTGALPLPGQQEPKKDARVSALRSRLSMN